ncbi:hypothetical protein ACFGVR_06330 [Mucilaginibacter sp. AW1-3]
MAKGHGPVNNDLAKACVKNYHQIFKGALDPRIVQAFTEDVVFDRLQLIAWLNSLQTDSIKISLGIYTPDFVAKYPSAKVNRLTTFLSAHNAPSKVLSAPADDPSGDDDGNPDNTYNLGTLTP